MQLDALLRTLGYHNSPNFLRAGSGEPEAAPGYGHIFRLAIAKRKLKGIYTLRPPDATSCAPVVPVVYVCDAESDEEAAQTHRLVWNQDVVPFLIVRSPSCIRLYSGFTHRRRPDGSVEGVICTLRDFNMLSELIDGFHADRIDDGTVWQRWGQEIKPDERVDWRLLDSLRQLDRWLRRAGGLDMEVSHALIGKYVYLHYLRDRGILSDEKLARWKIRKEDVFGRSATLTAVERVTEELDEWLNGGIFPLKFRGRSAPTQEHLQRVAGTFAGDQPLNDRAWQLHLDFKAYDFSYIPIETLSVIYEQFLHAPTEEGGTTRGRDAGAYYTPIPVVNFMLAEMEDRHPLKRGMRVFDPSCGSGAFLVQCYRRLIEKEFPPTGDPPRPRELRDLLERSIYGIDVDPDACSVTELSLVLTLLNYVDPPDLENDRRIKLPSLRGRNILCENFFREKPDCHSLLGQRRFDWIVGNPPWKKVNPKKLKKNDAPVWKWMQAREVRGTPIGGNQVAQAFAWEIKRYFRAGGLAALLMPAMTLFEDPSKEFRAAFVATYRLASVANFANLAEVLFSGRSRVPAATIFFSRRPAETAHSVTEESIAVYSPFVANQEATRPISEHARGETWSLVLNVSEVRDVQARDVSDGSGLPWKLVVWGSHLDLRLLRRIARRFPSFGDLEKHGNLVMSEGLQLRPAPNDRSHREGRHEDDVEQENEDQEEKVEAVEEVAGKNKLDVNALEGLRRLVTFPARAVGTVEPHLTHVRKRGGIERPLSICRPPHVIVSAARNFAIYSNEFLLVPPRQVGIFSPSANQALLKAVALYLSSDFAYYHQFLTSTELGIKRPRATLAALRQMPVPLANMGDAELAEWADLHARLVAAEPSHDLEGELFRNKELEHKYNKLFDELNVRVFDALRMSSHERALVEDLVRVRLPLDDGKVGHEAIRVPGAADLKRYARRLKQELDAFVDKHLGSRHQVVVMHGARYSMVQIDLTREVASAREIEVVAAGSAEGEEMDRAGRRLRVHLGQWVYFNRNLRIFEGTKTFVFKPMQLFHWTESQAMFDAVEIVAQTLDAPGEAS